MRDAIVGGLVGSILPLLTYIFLSGRRLGHLEERVEGLKERHGEVINALGRIDTKLDSQVTRLDDKMGAHVARLEDRLGTFAGHLDERIDASVGMVRSDVTNRADRLEDRFETFQGQVRDLDARLDEYRKEANQGVGEVRHDILKVMMQVEQLSKRLPQD
jgi:DNA anti-recombination protein RmuC